MYFTSICIISFSSLIDSKHYFENINNCIFKFLFHCFRKLGFQQIFHYHPTSLYHMQVQCFCPFFVSCFNKYMILTTYTFFSLLSYACFIILGDNYPVEISHQINLSFVTVDKWKILKSQSKFLHVKL